MIASAGGYAIIDGDFLKVDTVSSSERAAKVNWLMTKGVMLLDHHPDSAVEMLWRRAEEQFNIECVKVTITKRQS